MSAHRASMPRNHGAAVADRPARRHKLATLPWPRSLWCAHAGLPCWHTRTNPALPHWPLPHDIFPMPMLTARGGPNALYIVQPLRLPSGRLQLCAHKTPTAPGSALTQPLLVPHRVTCPPGAPPPGSCRRWPWRPWTRGRAPGRCRRGRSTARGWRWSPSARCMAGCGRGHNWQRGGNPACAADDERVVFWWYFTSSSRASGAGRACCPPGCGAGHVAQVTARIELTWWVTRLAVRCSPYLLALDLRDQLFVVEAGEGDLHALQGRATAHRVRARGIGRLALRSESPS